MMSSPGNRSDQGYQGARPYQYPVRDARLDCDRRFPYPDARMESNYGPPHPDARRDDYRFPHPDARADLPRPPHPDARRDDYRFPHPDARADLPRPPHPGARDYGDHGRMSDNRQQGQRVSRSDQIPRRSPSYSPVRQFPEVSHYESDYQKGEHHHSKSSKKTHVREHSGSKHHKSMPTDSSGDSDLDTSTASSSDASPPRTTKMRGPPPPKMATFSGSAGTWKSFILQFKQTAKQYHWDESSKRKRQLECLRGKAIEFVYSNSSYIRKDYKRLVKELDRRFGEHDQLSMKRRQLLSARQTEDESLADWADRILTLVRECYRHADEAMLQAMATEAFLRGCREKHAAAATADKCPKTLSAALKYVRNTVGNQQAFLGKSYATRAVSFNLDSDATSTRSDSSHVSKAEEASKDIKKLLEYVQSLSKKFDQVSLPKNASPSRPMRCFTCDSPGHLNKDCPKKRSSSPATSPSRTGNCFFCRKPGHIASDCPEKRNRSPSPRRFPSRSPSPGSSN